MTTLAGSIAETEATIADKTAGVATATKAHDELQAAAAEADNKINEGTRRLQAVMVGKSEDSGVDKTYAEQLKGWIIGIDLHCRDGGWQMRARPSALRPPRRSSAR